MSNLRTISFRIPAEKVAELDKIAKAKDRDRSYLLNEAVANYVSEQRHPAALAEKNLGAPLKKELAKNAHTGTSFGPRKLGKTATKEIVHPVEDRSKPSSGPTRESAYDFLAPLETQGTISETQARGEAHSETDFPEAKLGRVLVFLSAKGGSGVTTLACNFAVSLARESKKRTLLIDLNLPLGDAAINLGMTAQYSTANAFQDFSRLDANFLRSLLSKHSSGLSVLPAPGEFSPVLASNEAIDRLLSVARQSFDFVVVDAGSRIDLRGTSLFDESASLYLIAQVGVSELRNANRMISQFFSARDRKLQVVLNRYAPQSLLFDEKQIAKALTRPAVWKIPDDYATARRTQNTAHPVALQDSPISRVIRQMARTACGLPATPEKKKGFSLFRRSR